MSRTSASAILIGLQLLIWSSTGRGDDIATDGILFTENFENARLATRSWYDGEKFRINLESFPLRAIINGTVAFWVKHQRTDRQIQTTAHLDVTMEVAGHTASGERPIHSRQIGGTETARGPGLAGAADRALKVAQTLVDRQVAALLSDPKLAEALVEYVKDQR